MSGGSLFCGFFLFFNTITIEYYNEVVNHSNYKNRYALCFLISYSIKTDRTPIIHFYPHR